MLMAAMEVKSASLSGKPFIGKSLDSCSGDLIGLALANSNVVKLLAIAPIEKGTMFSPTHNIVDITHDGIDLRKPGAFTQHGSFTSRNGNIAKLKEKAIVSTNHIQTPQNIAKEVLFTVILLFSSF